MNASSKELARLALISGAAWTRRAMELGREGKLNHRFVWFGVAGALEYVKAIAHGTVAPDVAIDKRRDICAQCKHSRVGSNGYSLYCGTPMTPDYKTSTPTCGCLIDGLTAVANTACPQAKWSPVQARVAK